jgi:nicotinamide mononucleotide transporter
MKALDSLLTNWIEIAGIITSLLGIHFSIKRKTVAWIWNIIASILYGILFYQNKLYSDMELQGFFILLAIFGLLSWKKNENSWKPQKSTLIELAKGLGFALLFGVISGYLHQHYAPNVSFPYIDSTLTGLSIWGTLLAANKKIENWYVWIFADIIYTGMYFQKELFLTGILYLVFVFLAIQGLISWKKKMSKR